MSQTEYFNQFIKMLVKNQDKSQEELFVSLEKWHLKKVGKNKYKDYDTFRVMKSTWYKNSR